MLLIAPSGDVGPGRIIDGLKDDAGELLLDRPQRGVHRLPLPPLRIDEPTLTMNFCVNSSPLAGREGKFVTSRQIWDRLRKTYCGRIGVEPRWDQLRRTGGISEMPDSSKKTSQADSAAAPF